MNDSESKNNYPTDNPVAQIVQNEEELELERKVKRTALEYDDEMAVHQTVPQVLKTKKFPPELVYDPTVFILVALTFQSWSWKASMVTLSSGRSGLVCSLLQWINAQYQTQRRWALWKLSWQAN